MLGKKIQLSVLLFRFEIRDHTNCCRGRGSTAVDIDEDEEEDGAGASTRWRGIGVARLRILGFSLAPLVVKNISTSM